MPLAILFPNVKTRTRQFDERRPFRAVLGPLAALLIITSCATTLWAAGQSVLSLWQRQRLAESTPRTFDWSAYLAARSAHVELSRDVDRGPTVVKPSRTNVFPTHLQPSHTNLYLTGLVRSGSLALPPPLRS